MRVFWGEEVDEGVEDDGGHDVDEEGDYFFAGISFEERWEGRGMYKEWKTREFLQAMMAHATGPLARQ